MVNGNFKDDLMETLKESMETQTIDITSKEMKKEGADSGAEFVTAKLDDMLEQTNVLTSAGSTGLFPIQLDPNVYDQAALFMRAPVLTYLESKGRRSPADTTTFNYIEMTTGFTAEWFTEMDTAAGTDTAATQLGTASICFEAVPFNLSDLLGSGQTAATRAQLLGLIQETLREGYENELLNGSSSSTDFDGLFTIARAHGVANDASHGGVSLDAMRELHADLRQRKKGMASFIVTDEYSHVDIQKEMAATVRNINTVDNIIAGVNPTAFQASAAEIPIIVSPYAPITLGGAGTVPTARSLGMFNEQNINIADLITPSFVEAGKTRPLATNGWVVQATTMYNTVPTKTAVLYDIDL